MRFWIALLALLLLPLELPAAVLAEKWAHTQSRSPDGMALGDVDGDGRNELAVISRGGAFSAATYTPGAGTLGLYDSDGNLRWELQTGRDLLGFPTLGNFDGDGSKEIAFCEHHELGKCFVIDGDQTVLFETPELYFPAMTNGGPLAVDIDQDGIDDLVTMSWGGEVRATLSPDGTAAWTYNTYQTYGDLLFGNMAGADIDHDGVVEIAFGGEELGGIYVLNANDGSEQWVAPNLFGQYGLYFWGSGPIFANLDADASLELVAMMDGYPNPTPAGLIAFDTNGTLLWRRSIDSEDFFLTAPAAADINGDGASEVVLQTSYHGMTTHRRSDGAQLSSSTLVAGGWMSPGFVDTNSDGTQEIVTGSTSRLYILNGALAEVDRYENANAGLYPSALVGDTDGNGRIDVLLGAWNPKQIIRIELPYRNASTWSAFGGSALHTGSVPVGDLGAVLGDDPAVGSATVLQQIASLVNQATGQNRTRLIDARDDMDDAIREYLRGNPHTGIDYLRQVIVHLGAVTRPTTTALQQRVAYTALTLFDQYIDRSQALIGPTHARIGAARTALTNAQNAYNANNYASSAQYADDGAAALRAYLDSGGIAVGDYCPSVCEESYLAWECRLVAVRSQVQALLTQYPGNADLTNANTSLRSCVVYDPDLVFNTSYPNCITAQTNLASFTAVDTTELQREIALALQRNTRLFIDDASVWFGALDAAAMTAAENYYAAGTTTLGSNDFANALAQFRSAYLQARPCTGTSFATPPNGLEGGGCGP